MFDKQFWADKRIVVTGGAGFIGSYVVEALADDCGVRQNNIVIPRAKECDLRDFKNAAQAVAGSDLVVHLAAVTGGIAFSRAYPATQYFDSTLIDLNVVEASRRAGVQKLVCLGNLFAYSADASMPLNERELFTGLPTDAHRGVGWLKRNLALVSDLYWREHHFPVIALYSANAYGPRDSLDRQHAHVIPSTIMKCLRDSELNVWGDGTASRDFLFAADIAKYMLLALEKIGEGRYFNIGSGDEITIRELVDLIVRHSRFRGRVSYDPSKQGGDARRCAGTHIAGEVLGRFPLISMDEGLKKTVDWYREQLS
jgi:GDP-L-fucose synthase